MKCVKFVDDYTYIIGSEAVLDNCVLLLSYFNGTTYSRATEATCDANYCICVCRRMLCF